LKLKINIIIISIITALFFTSLKLPAYGQSAPAPPQPPAETATDNTDIPEKADELPKNPVLFTLVAFIQSMEDLKAEIKNKEKEYKASETEDQKNKINKEITDLSQKLEIYEKDFERIATGVDWFELDTGMQHDFDWQKEIRDIFRPVIQGLKKVTERPMQIEKLRSEMDFYQKRLSDMKKAVENIQGFIAQSDDKKLSQRLKILEKNWKGKEQQISNQITVTRHRLDEKLNQKESLWKSGQNLLQIFFKSRGKNLLLSLLAFIIVFLMLRLLYRVIYRIIPAYKMETRPFYLRLFEVAYHFLTYIGATCALLIVLYIFNDWILLSIVIIFFIGLIWGAKQGISQFWEQTKLLLNIGAVRENERIIYNGIPWRIASLNLYSQLENPDLSINLIRIPLKELIGKISRPYYKDEPWFPCKVNEWVILSDGTFGQITMQSPEFVELAFRNMPKIYPTQDFLSSSPTNLSKGFYINSTFGIDYDHQNICTKEVPEKMKAMLTEKLLQEGFANDLSNLIVEFKEAGPSSLDILIIASFKGDAAPSYGKLCRLLQKIAVEAATQYGWGIPFPQMTLSHRENAQSI